MAAPRFGNVFDREQQNHHYNGADDDYVSEGEGIPLAPEQLEEDEVDLYGILNVSRDATPAQIRTAYHALSRRYHPDKQPPHLRDQATEFFNLILLAYETLMNPHKRIIYDELGMAGIREHKLEVGVKTMSPAEFKLWLQNNMRKSRQAELEELITSNSKVTAKIDLSGLRYVDVRDVQDGHGNWRERTVPLYTGLSQFNLKHRFSLPLEGLGDLMDKPLPTSLNPWKQKEEKAEPPQKQLVLNKPLLSFDLGVGGKSVTVKGKRLAGAQMLAAPTVAATVSHSFPALPPDTPRSVATLLQGNTINATFGILPQQVLNTTLVRQFGQNTLQSRATFISPTTPPILEFDLHRRLGLRHSFMFALNTGTPAYPSYLLDVLHRPPVGTVRNGHASIVYTYHPVTLPQETEDDPDAPKPSKASRSKLSETYTVALTGGLLAGGGQVRFTYGRTFYIASAIGAAQRRQNFANPNSVGIRLGADLTIGITGDAAWTLKATRRVFERTTMGITLTTGGPAGPGLVFGVVWSRLGQTISIPVILAPFMDPDDLLYATAGPLVAYVLAELVWFRPRNRRIIEKEKEEYRKAQRAHTLKRRQTAMQMVELMRTTANRKTESERREGGLVILKATWGPKGKRAQYAVDVTVQMQALVENHQIALPRGVNKSRLPGFYDPVPAVENYLTVEYEFRGVRHRTEVKGKQGLVIPMREHRAE